MTLRVLPTVRKNPLVAFLMRSETLIKPLEVKNHQEHISHCTPAFATGTLCGRRIVIIDDVCTTCATLEACAMPLFAAGAEMVWGLVLARPVA